jgi:hypothetical protein
MSLIDLARMIAAARGGSAKQQREARVHIEDENRSTEWNAWRATQALHPEPKYRPIGRRKPRPTLTAAETRSRRASTRAQRARQHRAQSLDGSS